MYLLYWQLVIIGSVLFKVVNLFFIGGGCQELCYYQCKFEFSQKICLIKLLIFYYINMISNNLLFRRYYLICVYFYFLYEMKLY